MVSYGEEIASVIQKDSQPTTIYLISFQEILEAKVQSTI